MAEEKMDAVTKIKSGLPAEKVTEVNPLKRKVSNSEVLSESVINNNGVDINTEQATPKPEKIQPIVARVPIAPTLNTKLSSLRSSPTTSKKSSEDAEDDDDDDDGKFSPSSHGGQDIDPERLKAFNMFCRLFVDENLDRIVPISKQPKEKVQAILDACDRQFPEFHERSRKRVRTYLKSCRRMRRAREMHGWDPVSFRPTPPHLTSPIAEALLSRACENESRNAKRMRMGLEPIAVGAPPTSQPTKPNIPVSCHVTNVLAGANPQTSLTALLNQNRMLPTDWAFPPLPQFRPELAPLLGANGFVRPGQFPGLTNPAAAAAVAAQLHAASQHNLTLNAPTSIAGAGVTEKQKAPTPKPTGLTAPEIANVRQKIIGYRESATFLNRAADDLEQLINQNK